MEISRLGSRTSEHVGSCGEGKEVLSMGVQEPKILNTRSREKSAWRRPQLSGRQLQSGRVMLRIGLEELGVNLELEGCF